MGILVDKQIRDLSQRMKLLDPFSEGVQGGGVVSYGVSHGGYDLRLGQRILFFKDTYSEVVDPKAFGNEGYNLRVFDEREFGLGERVIISARSYILGYSLERFCMPNWLKGHCVGKSTYARCGLIVNTTPAEPGWQGYLTIEIANANPCPVAIYVGEGIAQVEFHKLDALPEKDYADKQGKYQNQGAQPVPAKTLE